MKFIARLLYLAFYHGVARRRRPDQIIGEPNKPYLLRWWIFRHPQPDAIAAATGWRKRVMQWRADHGAGLYLHLFLQSDDDRALHDHPWNWWSMILDGAYKEHRDEDYCGYPELLGASVAEQSDTRKHYDDLTRVVRWYEAGSMRTGRATDAHRIELFHTRRAHRSLDMRYDLPWMTQRECDDIRAGKFLPVWTLFGMGYWQRVWGFHCPKGWVPWQDFTSPTSGGNRTGAGCGEFE